MVTLCGFSSETLYLNQNKFLSFIALKHAHSKMIATHSSGTYITSTLRALEAIYFVLCVYVIYMCVLFCAVCEHTITPPFTALTEMRAAHSGEPRSRHV